MCKPLFLLTILLLFILLLCFILGTISHCAPMGVKDKATIEQPYYFINPSVRWGEITDFAVCKDTLYLLFSGKEVLDCYSVDGTYLHSYSIKLGEKGKAALYVNNGVLYLKSKGFTFYTFCDGIFVESYDVLATELYSTIKALAESKREAGEFTYELRGTSIWRDLHGVSKEVVHRPSWMVIFQGSLALLIGPISFIVLCIILHHYYKKHV